MHSVFTEAQIPIETVETDENSKIAIIFERVNRGGVPLDTYQLLAAWTWSGDFDLRTRFEELTTELDDFAFSDLSDEPDLLLKCCAAVVKDHATAAAVIELSGIEVRSRFEEFRNGVKGAIDFLQRECHVASLRILPYPTMLVPLARFFATDKAAGVHPNAIQREALIKWFWQSCFSRRYSSSVDNAVEHDIQGMISLLNDDASILVRTGNAAPSVKPDYFLENTFSLGAVNSKTFVLLLAQASPLSFLSGAVVNLDQVLQSCNRNEFHHIYPKNYLFETLKIVDRDIQYRLANFAFLSQRDNRSIKDKPPAQYEQLIPAAKKSSIYESAFIPAAGLTLSFEDFCDQRAKLLADCATTLCS